MGSALRSIRRGYACKWGRRNPRSKRCAGTGNGRELLTIASDSHRPDHVGFGLETALDVARKPVKRLCTYEGRQVAHWLPI